MPRTVDPHPARGYKCLPLVLLVLSPLIAQSQLGGNESPHYARVSTFGVFAAYSNDSLPFAEEPEKRKLVNFGLSYSRRLRSGNLVDWQYSAEVAPIALESDPLSQFLIHQTSPTDLTETYDSGPPISCKVFTFSWTYTDPEGVTHSGTTSSFCHGRQWTMGAAISPVGFQWNFRPRHKIQPLIDWHGGYMFSTQAIPIDFAGSFNFTLDVGAGLEFYRSKTRSIRVEYRFHHLSNAGTAEENPGVDSGLFQVTYTFGH